MAEKQIGPTGYENWRASLRGGKPYSEIEIQFYSDSRVTAEVTSGCGPYSFFNTLPLVDTGVFAHVITARIQIWIETSTPDMSITDYSRYHGGWLPDELSALCSLAMGVRLKAGRMSRQFDSENPQGRPRADTEAPVSVSQKAKAVIVPRAQSRNDIRESLSPRLASYPNLDANAAITLVRAARLYQDALWIVEEEPELAWLLLVAAVEVVATHHQVESADDVTLLRQGYSGLYDELISAGGEELAGKCAKHLKPMLRATGRFITFLDEHMPPPPPRPETQVSAIPWDRVSLRKALRQIYSYRSEALHTGTPFPRPMCQPPIQGNIHMEKPAGFSSATNEGSWLADATPMLLHVFEHVARGAILKWWDKQAGVSSGQDTG